jgi:hypothetical protein
MFAFELEFRVGRLFGLSGEDFRVDCDSDGHVHHHSVWRDKPSSAVRPILYCYIPVACPYLAPVF